MTINFTRHAAGVLPSTGVADQYFETPRGGAGPLVSCLMVTRGNPEFVASALACFRAQTWVNKELVVVCDDVSDELRELLNDDDRIRLVDVSHKVTLGDLRNLAVANSTGTYVCQWDDDDLYDPRRIAVQMGVLTSAGVMSVFMNRWLIWWPGRDTLALSNKRVWEGSMLAHRSVLPIYPSMPRKEDSYVAHWVTAYHATALLDWPQMYCYRVTGQNTWDEAHFDRMMSQASKIFEGEEKQAVLQLPCFRIAEPR